MKNLISIAFIILGLYSGSVFACTGSITDPLLCETPEILFSESEASVIQEKAQTLGSVVKIGTDQIMGIRVPVDIVPQQLSKAKLCLYFTVFSFLVGSVTWRKTKYCQPIINRLSR
jgi:hypothetical protein